MAYIDTFGEDSRPALLRWMGCAAIVLALHGIVGFALTRQPSEVDDDSGAPVVTIELMPMSVAPSAPPTALAPGPPENQPESEARPSEEVRHEEKQPEEKKVEVAPAPEPMLTLPPPTPEEAKKPEEPKEAQPEPKPEAPVPTAPPRAVAPAERPAAPAVGRVAQPTPTAIASWQRQLMAHLERHKRFPPEARGAHGIATLAFSIDRNGRVLASRIVGSSGLPALDSATVEMIRRASPLPPPPTGMSDRQLSFTLPIRYKQTR
jgi:protein TonB